jgi:DNA-binding MarR family transcriptional regulator
VDEPAGVGGSPQLPLIWHLFSEDAVLPRLLLLAKMIERVTARQLQTEFGLSLAQWRVLAFVCISGPATAAFIGDAAEVDQAEISRAVKALEGRRLVTRSFEPGNRKRLIIAPTADGAKTFKRVRRMRQAYFARMTRKLSREQMTQINRSLAVVGQEVVVERSVDD